MLHEEGNIFFQIGRGKLLAVLILLAVLFTTHLPTQAAESEEVIRVGILDYKLFSEQREDGSVSGYCIDYLNEMAKYTNLKFEYVFADWKDLRTKLERHEVDLIYTRRTEPDKFDFSNERFVITLTALYARVDDDDFYYDDIERMDGAKIGYLKNTFYEVYLSEYAVQRGFSYEKRAFDTQKEMLESLKNREIDAIASDTVLESEDVKCVGNYGAESMYFATWKGNPVMDKINFAMSQVTSVDYRFTTDLFAKYFLSETERNATNYTREEAEFIRNCPVFRIGCQNDIEPMAYNDAETGEFVGITPAILNLISQNSGIKFEYFMLEGKNQQYEYSFFRDNGIDLLASVEVNSINENASGVTLTDSYLSNSKVMVGRIGENISLRDTACVAIVGGSATLPKVVDAAFPNFEVKAYDSVEHALEAVKRKEADTLIYNQYLVERYLSRPQYESLVVIPQMELPERVALSAINYEGYDEEKSAVLQNPMLITVLNKAIASVSEQEKTGIIIQYAVEKNKGLSMGDFAYKMRYPLMGISFLVLIVIGLFAWAVRIKEKSLQQMSAKNALLSDAIMQANAANETKGRFLAQMSHEIRTPLNAIIGMTALTEKVDNNPDKTKEYIGKIKISSQMLLNIINDVLDMSAIESNKLRIAHDPFSLEKLLTSISSVYYSQCANKGIDFQIIMTDVIEETLIGDALRVNQILMNLTSNAYKFTEAGGAISIAITKKSVKKNNIFVRFEVADTGCGMSQEMQGRLFQAFEQESASTAKKYGGSGLGLAITKNLVEMMHGAIKVKSTEGEGSTFIVDLPFEIQQESTKPDERVLGNLRVLVIDDDEYTCQYMGSVLEQIGVQYDFAYSGEEGIEKLKQSLFEHKIYDVCFVDWKMPSMSGIEVTKHIRGMVHKESIVIIVSAYDLSEVSDEAKAAGADAFISKPFFQSAIFNTLLTAKNNKNNSMAEEIEQEQVQKFDFTGKRALVAEDFELNREVAADLLEEVNLEVDFAVNGKEAVEKFEASQPGTYDIILMDIQMPEMDGYEAARCIRKSAHPQGAKIPIYAMTANAFNEDVAASLSAGMNGHISKPIDVDILYNVLKKNLSV